MARRKSKDKKRKRASVRDAARKNQERGALSHINTPQDMELIRVKGQLSRWVILPFIAGKGNPHADEGCEHYNRTYYTHNAIGINRETVVCPRKSIGAKCPICEMRDKLAEDWSNNEREVKALKVRKRQLFLVVDLKDTDKGAQLFEYSWHLFGKRLEAEILNAEDDEVEAYENFYDPEDGMMLKVSWEEKSLEKNIFYEADSIGFKSRPSVDSDLFEDTPCLDDLLLIKDYDELKKMLLEMDDEDAEEEDDDKPIENKKKKDKKKKEEEDEDDDDDGVEKEEDDDDNWDDDDDDDDEDDDEEPVEKKKGKKKNKKKKEEEEEDDDDDDDWDDD